MSVSIPADQKITLSEPNGILYQLSGSTEVSAGEAKTITSGGGVLIAGGTTAALTAGNGEQSTLLFFLLAPKEALDHSVAAAPAMVNELYRTAAPLPELVPHVNTCPIARNRLAEGHDLDACALRLALAFYRLVVDAYSRNAGADALPHHAAHGHDAAVSGVAVHDHGNRDAIGNPAGDIRNCARLTVA